MSQSSSDASLEEYGWTPDFADTLNALEIEGAEAARIIRRDQLGFALVTARGEAYGLPSGALREQQGKGIVAAVGDWVAITWEGEDENAIIHAVLPRFSKFSRREAGEAGREQVLAANINTVFLMMGLDADFNLRRLERYLILATDSGAAPVIVLNKTDLEEEADAKIASVEAIAGSTPVVAISAATGDGLESLSRFFKPGETVAFLGSSGVGKSTLVNVLAGEEVMPTAAVRETDSRGRHTTVYRVLIRLPSGAIVMDTPGMRELQLWGSYEAIMGAFEDLEELGTTCRFRNCTHRDEPGCALKAGVESGEVDADRFESFLKIRDELAEEEERQENLTRARIRQRGQRRKTSRRDRTKQEDELKDTEEDDENTGDD